MNNIKKLSIVVPVYNEEKTVEKIIEKIYGVDFGEIKTEVILVNDGSTDNTFEIINGLKNRYPIKVVSYSKNKGKGMALRVGFKETTGDVVTIQDGDLEYDPNDFKKMLKEMSKDEVLVVYGSRRLGKKNVKYSGLSFFMGGLFLTYMVNILYGGQITDEPTGYKMFDGDLLRGITLKSEKFEFCPEVTAKILKRGIKIIEVPISYHPRNIVQGKKIKLKDFFEAVWTLIKYRFVD